MNDLMERYIYAVVRKLPQKSREDVSKELKTLIEDMLEERCGEIVPTEHDLRVVLAELGTPGELAQKYLPEGKNALISEPYYSKYKLVLSIVTLCVLFGMTVAHLIIAVVEQEQAWFMYFWEWLASVISSEIFSVGLITILFAVFDWKNVSLEGDSLSELPPVPKKSERIGKADPIIGILISVIFMVLFLFFPSLIGFVISDGKTLIPMFNAEYIHSMAPLVVLFGVLGISREIFKMIEGRYTLRLLIYSAAVDLISIPLTIFMFGRKGVVNAEGIAAAGSLFEDNAVILPALENFHLFFCGIILFALVLNLADTLVKFLRIRKEQG